MKLGKPAVKGMNENLIAPCGMNCRLCMGFVRDKNVCPGCREDDRFKQKSCVACRIKKCEKRVSGGLDFCFNCETFPCARMKQLDKRYRTKYGMSMIENLRNIQEFGIGRFVENEKERWTCPRCGETLCVHRPNCFSCGYQWH
jgi:hypothetical protein